MANTSAEQTISTLKVPRRCHRLVLDLCYSSLLVSLPHEHREASKRMLQGILSYAGGTGSVNLYMAHGGSNFGYWAGTDA
jgi:Glycosyl hydrolases family 35